MLTIGEYYKFGRYSGRVLDVLTSATGQVALVQFAKNILRGQRPEYIADNMWINLSPSSALEFLAEIETGLEQYRQDARAVTK